MDDHQPGRIGEIFFALTINCYQHGLSGGLMGFFSNWDCHEYRQLWWFVGWVRKWKLGPPKFHPPKIHEHLILEWTRYAYVYRYDWICNAYNQEYQYVFDYLHISVDILWQKTVSTCDLLPKLSDLQVLYLFLKGFCFATASPLCRIFLLFGSL